MIKQVQEDTRWQSLMLLILLPILAAVLLLCYLSLEAEAEPGIPPPQTSHSRAAPGAIANIEPGVAKFVSVAGTQVVFTHTVTNTGDVTDTFYFAVHSAQGWQVTVPPSDTWGINESKPVTFGVTIPLQAQVLSDTLVITATPQLAPAYLDTATDRIRDGRVFLPIVSQSFCEVAPLCNGDFETGDLSCWSHSRYDGPNELPTQIGPGLSGNYSALLGDPGFYCWGGVPIGRAWMEQSFIVPNNGNPTLTFTYEIHTQHTIDYDSFEVYLNGHRILKVGYDGIKPGCDGEPIVASDTCTIDLMDPTDCYGNPIDADFRCAQVTLRFENWNRSHNFYNTWTYVDDVEFSW